jgi:hypothetical protein
MYNLIWNFLIKCGVSTWIPPRMTVLSSKLTRPLIVLTTDSGCSKISFNMKESNEPFMISSISICNVVISLKIIRNQITILQEFKHILKNCDFNTSTATVPAGRLFDVFVDELRLEHSVKSVNGQATVGRHWGNVVILKRGANVTIH